MKTEKYCSICKRTLPISEFRVRKYRGKLAGYGDFHESTCRECSVNVSKTYYRSSFKVRFAFLINSARHHTKKIGQEFNIDKEYLQYLFDKQDGLCYYTSKPLSLESGNDSISLDRIDPNFGYIAGNVVLTCWIINNMKRNLSEQEFYELIGSIVRTKHLSILD